MKSIFSALSACIVAFLPSLHAEEPAKALPKVLIIGDSISMAYHKTVVRELDGKARVSRIPGNGEYTGTGIKKIDEWLGDTRWDVIHFNWGLWDMYGWQYTKEDRSPATYADRLDKLVTRMKQTGARLIWATTTPVCPEPESTMRKRWNTDVVITPELEKQYRDAALDVMKKHGVAINDLHALILPQRASVAVAANDVHFNDAGSETLGRQVAESIRKALP
jgi:acyl-CoA thioesterase-1